MDLGLSSRIGCIPSSTLIIDIRDIVGTLIFCSNFTCSIFTLDPMMWAEGLTVLALGLSEEIIDSVTHIS